MYFGTVKEEKGSRKGLTTTKTITLASIVESESYKKRGTTNYCKTLFEQIRKRYEITIGPYNHFAIGDFSIREGF